MISMEPIIDNNTRTFNSRPTFGQQLKALIKRNIIIKRRNRGRTLLELLFPLYMIILIVTIKSSMKPKTTEAIPEPRGYGTNWFVENHGQLNPDFRSVKWFLVSSNKSISNQIQNNIKEVLKSKDYPDYHLIDFNSDFNTSDQIESYYISNKQEISFAIVFDNFNDSQDFSYIIRMPYNSVPNDLNKIGTLDNCPSDNPFWSGCDQMKYFSKGFTFLQSVIDSALIKLLRPDSTDYTIPLAKLLVFPKPEFTVNTVMWQSFVPTYLSWCFMPSISILTVMFVLEKERKIKEGMLMMGLRLSAYWFSWILVQTFLILVISLVLTLILYFASILENVNPILLFLLNSLFGISTIGISALISPFFKKEKAAGSFVSFITLIAGCVHLLFVFFDISPSVYYILSLISPVAFTLGLNAIAIQTEGNISFDNLFAGNFSLGSALLMLVFDCIVYTVLAIYLDQVLPGEYGPKQSLFFFLKKSFWFPNKNSVNSVSSMRRLSNCENNPNVEQISDELSGKAVISIENLSKVYGTGKKCVKAVDDLSFTVYESQITGLLGHNGAGKSTLINMLVGNIVPTSGTAYIYGHNISEANEMNALRQMFGVCLQQDILFDELNSVEHLSFFAQIKGVSNNSIDSEVNRLLTEVQLFDDRLTPSKKLSGGQKRKLCVAIALIGNPKIILLDEPSSGVDPYSRRQLWSLLQSYKKDRVIILSTHFMDEADLLADRKAIIAKGRLRCVGSSLFLKNRFGIGYHLTVEIQKGTDVDLVNKLVQSQIGNAQIERFTTSEVFYILPPKETKLFPKLFDALEQNIPETNGFVKSYGISMTTLEEVFLKIGEEVEVDGQTNGLPQYTTNEPDHNSHQILSEEQNLKPNFFQSFKAFLYIRILIFIRNPMHTIPILLLPIIMIIVSYFLMKSSSVKNLQPDPLLLDPNIYTNSPILLYKNQTFSGSENFVTSVDKLGIKAEAVNKFELKSMSTSFMAINITSFEQSINWEFLFNDTYYHSLPILQNLMTNVFNKFLGENGDQKQIKTFNHPFPQINDSVLYTFDPKVYTYVILMAIMLGSIPPSIAVEVVEDRESKIKNQLRVCGLGFCGYWITTLVCHLIMFMISILLVLIVTIFIIKVEFLQNPEAIGCVFLLFLLFMPTSLLTCYLMCHMFNKKDTARSVLPLICYLPGMIMIIFVSIFSTINPNIGKLLHIIFCVIWPFYAPQGGLLWIATTSNLIKIQTVFGSDKPKISYFDWNQNISICFVTLSFQLVLCLILLVIVDRLKSGQTLLNSIGFRSLSSNRTAVPSEQEDEDVKQERVDVKQYLQRGSVSKTPIVLLNDLFKRYSENSFWNKLKKTETKSKIVVQNVNLFLESGNIFGLLGPNGAGKTTTMKIMICEEQPTEGTVMISGHNVKSSDTKIFQLIGYCPQHDALWKEITLIEHMRLFASIRGIPQHRIETVCQNYIESMKISEHSEKKTQQLSGGTKRKLCYLMALLGRPKLVLLDEPSTGMDPKAKRFLWKTILTAFERNSNRSAILTTHSMEEADALCTRLAIMVKGVMRCIGTVQHLKNKYGAGYVLEIKCINQKNDVILGSDLKQTIQSFFTNAVIKEEYNNRLIYDIPQESVNSIAKIFIFLENLKQNMSSIEEYSFSQKTIEQVFIEFAKEQELS